MAVKLTIFVILTRNLQSLATFGEFIVNNFKYGHTFKDTNSCCHLAYFRELTYNTQ